MNDREKLIELQKESVRNCDPGTNCLTCCYRTQTDCMERITADYMLANGVTVKWWIPVAERLPDVGSIVLVSDNETDCRVWQYTNYSERGVAIPWTDEFGIPCKTEEITHWMPLPEPPKED